MGSRLRRFLLIITSPFPLLHRWLKKYFIEHEEYEFILKCSCDDEVLGCYDQQTGVIELHLANMSKHYEPIMLYFVYHTIEHETLHKTLLELGAHEEFIKWYERTYGGVPFLQTLSNIEEWVVKALQHHSSDVLKEHPPFPRPPIPGPTDVEPDPDNEIVRILRGYLDYARRELKLLLP